VSRIGKMPVPLPDGVEAALEENKITVKGPLGELSQEIPGNISLAIEERVITVERPSDEAQHRALHGLTRALVANMVEGVSKGFQKNLEIHGVGYRAAMKGDDLELLLGFSHPVTMYHPEGIRFELVTPTRIRIHGIDKQKVGQIAAEIRRLRPPNPYKGKGVRYQGEIVRKKAGKSV
jgi:large subunit ribosomal protein L6